MDNLNNIIKEMSQLSFIEGIILFGSQLNGNSRQDSDIDIAVLTNPNKSLTSSQESKILGFSNKKIDISIFNNLPLIIQFRIIREGKILFLRNERLFHDIKYPLIRKYLDFSVFINHFYRRVIKNV